MYSLLPVAHKCKNFKRFILIFFFEDKTDQRKGVVLCCCLEKIIIYFTFNESSSNFSSNKNFNAKSHYFHADAKSSEAS